ncbi:hypothetical protein SUDANB15_06496 [Streptomyces sp. enrichment culture]
MNLGDPSGGAPAGVRSTLGEEAAETVAHRPGPGLLLLRDLRGPHLDSAGNSLYREMPAQAARHDELLALASACRPETPRRMRRTSTMAKNLSPQVLTSPWGNHRTPVRGRGLPGGGLAAPGPEGRPGPVRTERAVRPAAPPADAPAVPAEGRGDGRGRGAGGVSRARCRRGWSRWR